MTAADYAARTTAQSTATLEGLISAGAAHPQGLSGVMAEISNDQTHKWLSSFVTQDPLMMKMKTTILKLSKVDDPVLITGPSGTGKEILAHALHGKRDPRKFYSLNCAALPETLIESELFGHRMGAFTGASYASTGMFRAAGDGTVFLDEIGEAPPHLQAKLLRVLQPAADGKRYVRPVGDTQSFPITCRIVAATKRNLLEDIASSRFREDLYGRLMVFEVNITPLSNRPDDIPLILSHFNYNEINSSEIYLNPHYQKAIDLFNVRALQSIARRWEVLRAI